MISKGAKDYVEPDNPDCRTCFDEHCYWDSLTPCKDCPPGRKLQHEQDKLELKRLEKQCRQLRKKIKNYERSQ